MGYFSLDLAWRNFPTIIKTLETLKENIDYINFIRMWESIFI